MVEVAIVPVPSSGIDTSISTTPNREDGVVNNFAKDKTDTVDRPAAVSTGILAMEGTQSNI